jgi:hypothetical protein
MSGVASVTLIGGENIRDELIIEQRIQKAKRQSQILIESRFSTRS